jgi:hypothetical protein
MVAQVALSTQAVAQSVKE